MPTYKVQGPTKLSGSVKLQGAKNAAMKHILIPLAIAGKYKLSNIPDISSSHNLLEIVKQQGAQVKWVDPHQVEIDSRKAVLPNRIPVELFYHTSAAILAVPALLSKFGICELEVWDDRKDRGGCSIGGGTRTLMETNDAIASMGVKIRQDGSVFKYELDGELPFIYDAANRYMFSLVALALALFRKGKSRILNATRVVEFRDSLELLKTMGAVFEFEGSTLIVQGGEKLKSVDFGCMYDRHDFATFLSAALCTDSELMIENVDFEKLGLKSLDEFVLQSGVELVFDKEDKSCLVKGGQLGRLKSVNLVAGDFPDFVTEWQVLLSPLFAQIKGESRIVDSYYTDRMRHWEELGKMGARYEFFKDSDNPEDEEGNPRAVKVMGRSKFGGAEVVAKDVRSGAALIIAGLSAKGETIVKDPNGHINRGYERLSERLNELGAKIETIE